MKRFHFMLLAFLAASLFFPCSLHAETSTEERDLSPFFKDFAAGTFVLYDETADRYLVYNTPQADKRLSPCSTFKIYNALAGLESGVLDRDDAKTRVKWDGEPYDFPGWSQDQTLASAIKYSVVWYFQDLAGRIGTERMQGFLDSIGYGNRDMSAGLTTFWLESSLKISAREQVDLLYKLYSGKLTIHDENLAVVRKDITLSDEAGVRLMGKTGSSRQNGKWVLGWFVGCVEKNSQRYFFAVNIESQDGAKGPVAKETSLAVLRSLGIL